MRGRLGSMGSVSSFEKVSVLDWLKQEFTQEASEMLAAFKSMPYSISVPMKGFHCVGRRPSTSVLSR